MASPPSQTNTKTIRPALQHLEDRITPTSSSALESVTNLYRLTLNRPPDSTGLAHFTARLDAGAPVASVASSLLGSTEHREKIVVGYFQGILGRQPDPAGLASHVSALGQGVAEEQLVASMLASPEKSATLSDTAFVDLLYRSVLGRGPDTAGQSAQMGALATGTSRTALALSFLESREASTTVVDNLYAQLLGRSPTSAEKQGWITSLSQGNFSYADAVTGFVASPEGSGRLAGVTPLVSSNEPNIYFWQQRIGLNTLGGVVTAATPAPYVYFLDKNPESNSSLTPPGYAVVIDGAPAVRDPIAASGRLTGFTMEFAGGADPSHVSWDSIKDLITQWTGDITNSDDRQTLATSILTQAMGGMRSFANFPTKAEAVAANGNLIWAQDFEAKQGSPGQESAKEIAASILAVSWAGREILGDSMKIVPIPASAIVKGPPALGAPWNLTIVLSDQVNYLGKLELAQTMPATNQTQLSSMDLLSALHLAKAEGLPLIDGVLIQQYGAKPPGTPSADTPPFADTSLPYAVMSSLYGDPSQFSPSNPPQNPWNSYYFGDMPFTAGIYWAGEIVLGNSGFDPTKYLTPTLATTTWNGQTPLPA